MREGNAVPKNGKIIFFPALRPYLNFFFSMCIPIINEKINKSGIFSFGIKEKHCILWLLGNLKSGSSSLFPPYCFLFVSINSVWLNEMHLPAEIGQSS